MSKKKFNTWKFISRKGLFIKPLVPMTKSAKAIVALELIFALFSALVTSIIPFSLQISKNAIETGNSLMVIVFLAIYCLNKEVNDLMFMCESTLRDKCQYIFEKDIHSLAVNVLMNVKRWVWNNKNKHQLSPIEIQNSYKEVVEMVWRTKNGAISDLINLIALICSIFGFIFVSNAEIENVFSFGILIAGISVVYIYLSINKVNKNIPINLLAKEASNNKECIENDILNIDAINNEHLNYMHRTYDRFLLMHYNAKRRRKNNSNKNDIAKSVCNMLVIITVLFMKVYETGFENLRLETILSVVAIVEIYSVITGRITNMLSIFDRYKTEFAEVDAYVEEFFNIMKVDFERKEEREKKIGKISALNILKGEFEYSVNSSAEPFKVVVKDDINLEIGERILFSGPSGCGKSTMLKAISGNASFENFKVEYNSITDGKLGCIMHQTDSKLGCNDLLSELTFGAENIDESKLFQILKGLNLYDEFKEKDSDVIHYLSSVKAENFSTGQKQRLNLTRLLYNLKDDIQVIAFDEPTNALNDEITEKVIKFITEFCEGRLIIFVTHQVSIYKRFITKHYEYQLGDEVNTYQVG